MGRIDFDRRQTQPLPIKDKKCGSIYPVRLAHEWEGEAGLALPQLKDIEYVYHVTTYKKLKRYMSNYGIYPIVRFWSTQEAAMLWIEKVKRDVIIRFKKPDTVYPMTGHRNEKGIALWSPNFIYYKNIDIKFTIERKNV